MRFSDSPRAQAYKGLCPFKGACVNGPCFFGVGQDCGLEPFLV